MAVWFAETARIHEPVHVFNFIIVVAAIGHDSVHHSINSRAVFARNRENRACRFCAIGDGMGRGPLKERMRQDHQIDGVRQHNTGRNLVAELLIDRKPQSLVERNAPRQVRDGEVHKKIICVIVTGPYMKVSVRGFRPAACQAHDSRHRRG